MGAKKGNVITEQVDSRLEDLFGSDDGRQSAGSDHDGIPDEGSGQPAAGLDSRLDNFFEKEDKPEEKKIIDPKKVENSMIKDLKSVILSLEWEITDQVMQKLGEEIRKLEGKCKDDKIVVAFLQLLGSLGKYIRKKRADAHPDSIRLLNSVYENLETVMLSDDLSEAEKRKMLVTQVGKYKKLKDEIIVTKSPEAAKTEKSKPSAGEDAEEPSAEAPVSESDYRLAEDRSAESEPLSGDTGNATAAISGPDQIQPVLRALENIRLTIQSEIRALREDIRLLGKKE
ncbi:MAG: hypothetical protein AB7S75_24205 [Desulfococcaceae bacterium]